jgi:glycosyltransferase involved in cell wall biosynthesis
MEAARGPIRVAYFSDAPYVGGAEKYLALLASHLDRGQYEPVLIVNRTGGLGPLVSSAREAGIPVYEVSLRMPSSLRGVRHCFSLLRRLAPTVLHCNLPAPLGAQFSLIAPLARLAGVRHVVTTEHLPMMPSFPRGRLMKRLGTLCVARVITVSADNVRYLTTLNAIPRRKIRVVHIGIPDSTVGAVDFRKELGVPPEVFVVAIVGSLEERKGHRTAFQALARLPQQTHLVVMGSGEMEGAYRRDVAELALEARVHFVGYRSDVEAILRGVDALVLPSEIDATPYAIVEAMAAGLPIVASRIYGIPELVEDGVTGILVPPSDIGAIVLALQALIDDPARAARMGAAGRKRFLERFTIERSVSETTAVYREILGR